MSPQSIQIDPQRPDPVDINRCAHVIRAGGSIIFPTSGLYGLGADALSHAAIDRLFQIKQRAAAKPILVLIPERTWLAQLAVEIPTSASALITAFWPGSVTLVLKAKDHLPKALTAGSGKIGIRLPRHPVARALTRAVAGPVTGTSANISGHPGCAAVAEIDPELCRNVDLILDAGKLGGGAGSTVVDVTGSEPVVLRPGCIAPHLIRKAVAAAI